jgi:hypothetical protein
LFVTGQKLSTLIVSQSGLTVNRRLARFAHYLGNIMSTKQKTKFYYVIRINGDTADTYAAETLEGALDQALPDRGDVVECGGVEATDAGAARFITPAHWSLVSRFDCSGAAWSFMRDCERIGVKAGFPTVSEPWAVMHGTLPTD